MSGDLFWLTDEQFAKIEPLLPTDTRGKKRVDDHRVIRAAQNTLQQVRALGRQGCVGALVRDPGASRRAETSPHDRLLRREGPSLRSGRKTYGPPRRQAACEVDLSCLHKRIRPFGKPLAKMESRAFRSS